MITFLIYMLKVGLCTIAFYAVYKLALAKESFFRLNRIVILTSVALSLLLPIYTITITEEVIQEAQAENTIIVTLEDHTTARASSISPISKNDTSFWIGASTFIIYLIGVLFFLTKQIIGHTQIILLLKDSKRQGNIFLTDKAILPFSWFRRIVINKNDYNDNSKIILAHEHAHIQSKHFYDLLFINLLTTIQWFNPAAWLLKKELIANHEFSADEYVINQGINAKQYQLLLITTAAYGNTHIPVVSHLYSGSLVQRVKMMLEKKSKSIKSMKALLMLPFIFCAVLAFAETEYVELRLPAQELSNQTETEDSTKINLPPGGELVFINKEYILFNINQEIIGCDSLSETLAKKLSDLKERTGTDYVGTKCLLFMTKEVIEGEGVDNIVEELRKLGVSSGGITTTSAETGNIGVMLSSPSQPTLSFTIIY